MSSVIKPAGRTHEIEDWYLPEATEHAERLVRIAAERGVIVDVETVLLQWSEWSEDVYCAGWLVFADTDDAIFQQLQEALAHVVD